jgi:hypothetical protein
MVRSMIEGEGAQGRRFDVMVAGGGPAGLTAAIQAARAGATCLLVEKTGLLGGALTSGGVNFPGLFHAWGRQVIAGIGWEWVVRTVREFGGTFPDFQDDPHRHHSQRQVWVDRFTCAAVADAMVTSAGVELLLHSMPQHVKRESDGNGWSVGIARKEGPASIRAKVLIDATGDANLTSLAGFSVRRNAALQPATYIFRASGYTVHDLDFEHLTQSAAAAIARGELHACDFGGSVENLPTLLRRHGENILHVPGIDARTSAGKTEADLRGRAAILRLQHFFRKQRGLEEFRLDYAAPECGIRETATIDGEVEITAKDYGSGRRWEDAVCYSFYPIDIHQPDGHGIDIRPLARGVFPTIPLRALLPKGSRGLVAAGRIACGDQEAHSAFRVQASCMAMGQAAGAVGALAAQNPCDVRDVPLPELLEVLRRFGAIVPTADGPADRIFIEPEPSR